jgi:hypothetical protein
MSDTREQILTRILDICTGQVGFVSKVRNRGLLKTDLRPAVVLLDGGESPVLTHGGRNNRGKQGMIMALTPQIMEMKPELYITLPEDDPDNLDIGPNLNAKRIQIIKAIGGDELLLLLLGSNGGLVYNGCDTDLKSGGTLKGQMRLDFAYRYTLFPTTDQQGAS